MTEIRTFNEATHKLLLEMARYWKANGRWSTGASSNVAIQDKSPLYFENVSGEEIPPYACMQITGTIEVGDLNLLEANKPADATGEAGYFLFNGPMAVADGEYGTAQNGPCSRGFKDTGTVTAGENWAPVDGEWYIEQNDSGLFVAAGEDDVETDVVRVFSRGGGGSRSYIYKTPGGGIAAATGTGPYTFGSATCTIVDENGVVGSDTATVKNPWPTAIPASILVLVQSVGSTLFAIHPFVQNVRWDSSSKRLQQTKDGTNYTDITSFSFVTDVRWVDPVLEQSKDGGSTYTVIDTAEDCS